MASELQVTTLKGNPTGANANQILVPAGQKLHAPGHIVQVLGISHTIGSNIATTSASYVTSGLTSPVITPKFANSKIIITCDILE